MSQIPHDRPDDRWETAGASSSAGTQAPYTGTPHRDAPSSEPPATDGPWAGGPYTGGPPPQRYAPEEGSPTPTSAVVLLILSGLGLLAFVWTGLGLVWAAPVVLAVVAMAQRDDVAASRRLTKIGWIVYAVLAVLTVALIALGIGVLVWLANAGTFAESGYDPGTIAFTASLLAAR